MEGAIPVIPAHPGSGGRRAARRTGATSSKPRGRGQEPGKGEVLGDLALSSRDLLDAAPAGMMVVDSAGQIVVANRRMAELFGYSRDELRGMNVEDLLPRSMRGGQERVRDGYAGAPVAKRRDGSYFPADISLNPLSTPRGMFAIASIQDLTERKVAETRAAERHKLAEKRRLTERLVRAQEEERHRIAGDIHDDPIQVMTAVSLKLQHLARKASDDGQRATLEQLNEIVHDSIRRLRLLVFDLRPPSLDLMGLAAALRELAERIRSETDLEYMLRDDLDLAPAGYGHVELYRIAQEALMNVRKHSMAKTVTIELERLGRGVHLQIADDGVGFADRAAMRPGDHIGIVAMKERARIARGWCRIESRPGLGTTVDAWVPDDPIRD